MITISDNPSFQAAKRCHAAAVESFVANPGDSSAAWLRAVLECGILIAAVESGVPVVRPGVWSVLEAASVSPGSG